MAGKGLEEVVNPSMLFLSGRDEPVAGSAVFPAMEGTRPVLVEIQALVDDGLATQARGRGLMCAIDLPDDRGAQVVLDMLERGFLVNNTSARTVRFLPPLVITGDELTTALIALRDVLAS